MISSSYRINTINEISLYCLLLLTDQRYIFYSISFLLVLINLLAFISNEFYFHELHLKLFLCFQLWLLFPLIMSFFVFNIEYHIKDLIFSFCVIQSALILSGWLIVNKISYRIMFKMLIIFVFFSSIFYLLFLLGILVYANGVFSSMYVNRNTTAVVGSLLFVYAIFSYDKIKKEYSIFTINTILILDGFIILVTQSTKGLTAILISMGVFIMSGRNLKIKKGLRNTLICLLIFLCLTVFGEGAIKRAKSHYEGIFISNDLGSPSTIERIWLAKEAITIIGEKIITGVGMNNSQFYLRPPRIRDEGSGGFGKGGTYSHINYLEVALCGGVFAFLLYYLPLIIYFAKTIRNIKSIRNGSLIFTLLILKFFFDFAMVSYNSFANVLFSCMAIYLFELTIDPCITQSI